MFFLPAFFYMPSDYRLRPITFNIRAGQIEIGFDCGFVTEHGLNFV